MSRQTVMDFSYMDGPEDKEIVKSDVVITVVPEDVITEQAIRALSEYDNIKEYVLFDTDWIDKKMSWKAIIRDLKTQHTKIQFNIDRIQTKCEKHSIQSYQFIISYRSMDIEEVLESIPVVAAKLEETKSEIDVKSYIITRILSGTEEQLEKLNDYAIKIGIGWSRPE